MFVDRGGLTLLVTDPVHDAWQVTLDRIELDVIRAERALESGAQLRTDEWDVPSDHGPVPASLRPRAEEILGRQHVVLKRLAEQLGQTYRHQAVVERVGRTSPATHVPVYVDVSA